MAGERRRIAPEGIALERLQLDDVGAVGCQERRGRGPRDDGRAVDDAEALERTGHGDSGPSRASGRSGVFLMRRHGASSNGDRASGVAADGPAPALVTDGPGAGQAGSPGAMLWAMADLANLFSWSRSRAGMFEDCRRRYYYHYYGAWGGWDSSAPPDIRRLYVLKQLTGRQGWAGRTVHSAVELILRALHVGEALSEERLVEDTVRRMREEWRFSQRGGYRERPKEAVALFEHEYGVEVKDQVWQILRDHVCRCLRNFHRLSLLTDIRNTPRERWILLEDIRAFEFEGTPVYAAPDFGYWTREDRLALVDWKTGSPDPEGTAVQLGGYALYARDILDVPPGARGSARGEPPGGRGHRAPVGRGAARRHS